MPARFTIRPYAGADLDHAARAMNAAARKAYAFFGWNHPVEKTRERIVELLPGWSAVRVAEHGGTVIGIMALEPGFIDQFFIAPDWQGQGAGALLMAEAKRLYPARLDLDCASENRQARRFYERNGFAVVDERINETLKIPEVTYRWAAAPIW
jgi:putative acetyltransferase